jgi:hypothetical protein
MRIVRWAVALTAVFPVVACSPQSLPIDAKARAPSTSLPFLPKATIQDLMEFEIDPAADFIWGSVGTVITAAGVDNRQPRTDEQWRAVRRNAITLVEATNLLIIPGRHVAAREFPSDGPGVLSSSEIERKLDDDRADFDAFALSLREAGLKVLLAADNRDVAALSDAGAAMDGVCESCHAANWYPHQVIPKLPDFKSTP